MSEVEQSSGNVFHDLGLSDAELMHRKAQLVADMLEAIRDQCLTRPAAAATLGISEAQLRQISRGNVRNIPLRTLVDHVATLQS